MLSQMMVSLDVNMARLSDCSPSVSRLSVVRHTAGTDIRLLVLNLEPLHTRVNS